MSRNAAGLVALLYCVPAFAAALGLGMRPETWFARRFDAQSSRWPSVHAGIGCWGQWD
jgi:hypothetical protein